MGITTIAAAGLGVLMAQGQAGLSIGVNTVRLEPPQAVVVGVKDVNWERQGRALMYDAVDADGYYQGLYRTADGKGKAVLRHPPGTQFHDWKWLPRKLSVVEIVSREDAAAGTRRYSVFSLDAQSLTARELLGLSYPKDEEVSVSMEISPSRDHGLITVRDRKGERTYVLLDNGTSLVLSADVTQAKLQGAGFAGWSADGTAYFRSSVEDQAVQVLSTKSFNGLLQFQVALDNKSEKGIPVLGDIPFISSLFLRTAPLAPAVGVPVFEVMPWNGGLRPVRSRGPFEGAPFAAPEFVSEPEAAQVIASHFRGQSGSVWLVHKLQEEGKPRPAGGTLVAAEAGQTWMPDIKNFIAYETAGALFVRQIRIGD